MVLILDTFRSFRTLGHTPPPTRETHLWHVAVDEAVFVVHDEVLQVLGREDAAFLGVAQTRLLQQLPAVLERALLLRQLQLLVRTQKSKPSERQQSPLELQVQLQVCSTRRSRSVQQENYGSA